MLNIRSVLSVFVAVLHVDIVKKRVFKRRSGDEDGKKITRAVRAELPPIYRLIAGLLQSQGEAATQWNVSIPTQSNQIFNLIE